MVCGKPTKHKRDRGKYKILDAWSADYPMNKSVVKRGANQETDVKHHNEPSSKQLAYQLSDHL
jgi:hypothetical protein